MHQSPDRARLQDIIRIELRDVGCARQLHGPVRRVSDTPVSSSGQDDAMVVPKVLLEHIQRGVR
jgi:hypothetical protein